jgi:hypothetical protein
MTWGWCHRAREVPSETLVRGPATVVRSPAGPLVMRGDLGIRTSHGYTARHG